MGSKKARWGLALVLLAVVGILAFRELFRDARAPDEVDARARAAPELVEPAPVAEELVPVENAGEPPAEERAVVEERPLEAAAPELPASMAEIRGRFLLEDGSPAAGVSLLVNGWQANQERVLKYGLPEDWQDVADESDADGRFALRFEPPRAYQFTLDASSPGLGGASWRWGEIPPGEVVDVGEVTLLRAGAIEGRIVDGDGNPITGEGWTVYADATGVPSVGGRDETRGIVRADPGTGSFRIEDMPPGRTELKTYHRLAKWVEGPTVRVVAGETVRADIVYADEGLASRITVSTSSRPFHVKGHPDEASIRLLGAPSGPISAERSTSSLSYTFDGLAPGSYTVEIDHPDYLPWRQEGVEPGTEVRARLIGSAALRLLVFDDDSGDPVPLYSLRVRFRNVSFFPNEFEVHDGTEPLPDGLFEGMFPGDYTLTVRAEGYGPTAVDVDGLEPGETRVVEVPLGNPTAVTGTVTRAGAGVAGVEVVLVRPAEVDDSDASRLLRKNSFSSDESRFRKELDATETDVAGRFTFVIPGGGEYLVLASQGAIEVWSERFLIDPGEEASVDLALPVAGRLLGRVLVPDGKTPRGLRVWTHPEGTDFMEMFRSFETGTITLDESGAFEIGSLAPGEVVVYLFLPERIQPGFSTGAHGPLGALELGTVEITEGAVVEQEFSLVDRFPGSVVVSVVSHGTPLADAGVTLEAAEGGRLEALADVHGVARFDLVFAGLWNVHVQDPEGEWTHEHPLPATVPAGAEIALDVDVQATEGTIALVDGETGEPLAARKVGVVRHDPDRPRSRFVSNARETDAEGRLTMTLTPGEYVLVLDPVSPVEAARASQRGEPIDPDAPAREARVTWTASGPVGERIEL